MLATLVTRKAATDSPGCLCPTRDVLKPGLPERQESAALGNAVSALVLHGKGLSPSFGLS